VDGRRVRGDEPMAPANAAKGSGEPDDAREIAG